MYDPLMRDILSKLNSVTAQPTKSPTSPPVENSSDMLDILKRFHLAESGEGKLTPVNVKHGLNAQQKSVGQTPANFKPKTTKVLTAPTDPKNPFAGKLVGGSESRRNTKPMIDEAEVSEDLLSDIKKSLNDYLKQIDSIEKVDSDLKKKDKKDTDLKKKQNRDSDLFVKRMKEDPTQENPVIQPMAPGMTNPTYADAPEIQNETLNNPSDLEVLENERDLVMYGSLIGDMDDPSALEIVFSDGARDGDWELEFTINGEYDITGAGDAFKVFATVAEAVKKFLRMPQGKKAKSIFFSAKEPSRIKLYDRFAKMMTSQFGLKRKPSRIPGLYVFEIPGREQPTPAMESLKTHECNGKKFEIFGDEKSGFGVRHNGKFSPSRFGTFLEADTALELFASRLKQDTDYRTEQ